MTGLPRLSPLGDPALLIAFVGYCLAMFLDPYRLSHDTTILLEHGARLVEGKRLYIDIGATHPPMVHYLHMAPAACARLLGGSEVGWLLAWLAALTGGATLWCRTRLASWLGPLGAVVVALSVVGFAFDVLWKDELGQRPHLFLLLATPYVVTRMRRMVDPEPLGLAVLAGLLGVLGACIKPHYLLAVGAFELVMLVALGRRWAGPGLVALILGGMAYGVHLLLLPPAVYEAFFEVWMPALLEGYDSFRMGGVQRRLVPLLYTVGAGFAASLALLRGPRLHAALALSAGALAGAWIFVLQDKGWVYQTLTGYGFAWMAIALALAGAIQRAPRGSLLVVCATVWLWQPVLERVQGEHIQGPNSLIRKVVQHSEVGDRVLVVSSNAYQSYPGLMIEQREVVSTFLIAWPIPILYADGLPEGRYRTREERSEAERRFATRVRRDLLRKKPQVVIVESRRRCGHCARGVSVVGYLEHIGFMKRLRRRYRKVGHAIHCDVWVREER